MSDKPTGGPAFPYVRGDSNHRSMEGMTLRDYLAAHALARIPHDPNTVPDHQAAEAYRMADALLRERDK